MKFIAKNWIFFVCLTLGLYLASLEKNISVAGMIFLGLFGGSVIFLFVVFVYALFKGKDNCSENETLSTLIPETDPEKVKARMLFIMQFGQHEGVKVALNEVNDIFNKYPQWELENWEVFRAWYKSLIDYALEHPDIFTLTSKINGGEYSTEADPLYDPNAPDWEQFDRPLDEDEDAEGKIEEYTYPPRMTLNERLKRPFGSGF